jgi:hypothetical protein
MMDSETIEKIFNNPKIIELNKPDIYFLDMQILPNNILLFNFDEYKQHLLNDTLIGNVWFLDELVIHLKNNNFKPEILEIVIDDLIFYVVYSEISNTDYCLWRLKS